MRCDAIQCVGWSRVDRVSRGCCLKGFPSSPAGGVQSKTDDTDTVTSTWAGWRRGSRRGGEEEGAFLILRCGRVDDDGDKFVRAKSQSRSRTEPE